jgi:uncharacterized protein YodC (DUF2158 family)
MENKFEIGDLVVLKSGGPIMTINSDESTSGIIACIWFDDYRVKQEGYFKNKALRPYN